MDVNAIDKDVVPSTFELGEIAWSRLGKWPYWPSKICHDPDTKKFTKVKESRRLGIHRLFHVEFYGGKRGKRAWVCQPHMLRFEGLEAFQELAKSAGKMQKAAFFPTGYIKNIWISAVEECLSVVEKSDDKLIELSQNVSTTSSAMKRKNTSHRGIKNYKCDECNQAYVRKSSLNFHIKRVHQRSRIVARGRIIPKKVI